MKKYLLLLIIFFQLSAGNKILAQHLNDPRIFQPAEMQADFNYLRKALEETHPGLYMHHTKEEMQYKMDSLYRLLDKPLPFLQFYGIVAYLISEVKCEHTYCNPYSSDYQKRVMQWKLIPFQLFFTNQKAYVTVNRSADTSIHFGDEILTINHYPVDSIKHVLYKYLPSDGNMESSKEYMLSSLNFNLNYYLFIERPEAFDMEFKNAQGQIITRHFNTALTLDENKKITLSNPANKEVLELDKQGRKLKKNPWRLKIVKEQNTAILTISTFSGDRKKLFKLYDEFFTTLQKEKPANLIVDLSYNGGGDEEYACELLSYLIDTPTRFIESEYLINDDDAYFKISNLPKEVLNDKYAFIDTIKDGKIFAKALTKYSMELKTFQPKPNGFHGKVFFYVNGGTSSAASTCAANAQSHTLATIVGDETAGSFAGGGSTNGLDLVLPNSKISAHTSIVYCKFNTTGRDKDRGVIPDHYFIPVFSEIINGNNSWKNFIYNLINTK
ncbi:MAG: S41 family peptidase [Bacteroidota bacterium]